MPPRQVSHSQRIPAGTGQEHREGIFCAVLQKGQRLLHHIPGIDKGEQTQAHRTCPARRQQHPEQYRQGACSVDLPGLQHLVRHGLKDLSHQEGAERQEHGRKNQRTVAVQQIQPFQHDVVGHQRHLYRHEHEHHQQVEQPPFAREGEFCESKTAQDAHQQLPGHDHAAHGQRAPEAQPVNGAPQKHLQIALQGKLFRQKA